MSAFRWTAAVAAAVMVAAPAGLRAQIGEAVDRTDRGIVRFSYETRPGVEICDQGVRFDGNRMRWRLHDGDDRDGTSCRVGIAEVELDVRDGRVREVEVVTPRERSRSARDLGEVTPGEAAGFLIGLVWSGADADAAEDAIFPATIADVEGVWRELVTIARDRSVQADTRKQALFWLGQEAAEAVARDLAAVASDESEDQEVRNSAVFALSQRDDEESISSLIEIAETAQHAETRRTAMFWLAQSDDPRVIRFFEDILLRKGI